MASLDAARQEAPTAPTSPTAKRPKKAVRAQTAPCDGTPSSSRLACSQKGQPLPTSLPARFVTVEGTNIGPRLDIPLSATQEQMERLVNQLNGLQQGQGTADQDGTGEAIPYAFYLNDREVIGSPTPSWTVYT